MNVLLTGSYVKVRRRVMGGTHTKVLLPTKRLSLLALPSFRLIRILPRLHSDCHNAYNTCRNGHSGDNSFGGSRTRIVPVRSRETFAGYATNDFHLQRSRRNDLRRIFRLNVLGGTTYRGLLPAASLRERFTRDGYRTSDRMGGDRFPYQPPAIPHVAVCEFNAEQLGSAPSLLTVQRQGVVTLPTNRLHYVAGALPRCAFDPAHGGT